MKLLKQLPRKSVIQYHDIIAIRLLLVTNLPTKHNKLQLTEFHKFSDILYIILNRQEGRNEH